MAQEGRPAVPVVEAMACWCLVLEDICRRLRMMQVVMLCCPACRDGWPCPSHSKDIAKVRDCLLAMVGEQVEGSAENDAVLQRL